MKAAVFNKPGEPLQIQEVDKPIIEADEMLVKVSRCGICGTDIHASRQGAFMAPPNTIFGHEFSGTIVEIGSKLIDGEFSLGDRVTSLPFIGDKTIGLGAITGAYSEYVKVGYDLVVKLPDQLDDQNGALVEPLAVGLHSVKMAGSVSEKNILIIGAGPIGLTCAIWCKFFGARHIVISERSQARVEMAKQFGFEHFVDPDQDVGIAFREMTNGEPEVQFECVGAVGLMQECIARAPKRGLIMAIGVCDNPDTIVPLMAFIKELRIQWAVGYDKEDFEFAIEMMVAGRINAEPMVTDVVKLEQVPDIFEALRQPTNQCKVIIDMSS
ncbi:MAG: (R,R)-butanediol dehydrogenase/meso-butanediol dehydrogenase/diacetyl reductase [Candidatus Azotimanducaceae bacterium]|jgi:(R,R)-butanediol dehydrogenase/meso-butanediol dehydrogenase/diacetyl reductase